MKTNKSVAQRLKITKKGKVLVRRSGHGHFNAKKRRTKKLNIKKTRAIPMSAKELGKYLPLEN